MSVRRIVAGTALAAALLGAPAAAGAASAPRNAQAAADSARAQGGLLQLEGGFVEGRMVLSGERPSPQSPGTAVLHRIAWEPIDADHVRQLWEAPSDGGETWTVVFDGTYTRVKG